MHRVSGVRHQVRERLRRLKSRKKVLADLHESRVLCIAMFEYIQIKGAVVDAGTEEHHVGRRVRVPNEIHDVGGAKIGLQLELGRKKAVKSILVQGLV